MVQGNLGSCVSDFHYPLLKFPNLGEGGPPDLWATSRLPVHGGSLQCALAQLCRYPSCPIPGGSFYREIIKHGLRTEPHSHIDPASNLASSTYCVTKDKLLNISEPQSPPL